MVISGMDIPPQFPKQEKQENLTPGASGKPVLSHTGTRCPPDGNGSGDDGNRSGTDSLYDTSSNKSSDCSSCNREETMCQPFSHHRWGTDSHNSSRQKLSRCSGTQQGLSSTPCNLNLLSLIPIEEKTLIVRQNI